MSDIDLHNYNIKCVTVILTFTTDVINAFFFFFKSVLKNGVATVYHSPN